MKPTNEFRYVMRDEEIIIYKLVEESFDKIRSIPSVECVHMPMLQQKWVKLSPTRVTLEHNINEERVVEEEWRDVPIVDEEVDNETHT